MRVAGGRRGPGVTGPCSSIQRRSSSSRVLEEVDLRATARRSPRSCAAARPGSAARGGRPPSVGPGLVVVLPGQVVDRAGGQHLDLVRARQPLRDPARVQLRPADDLLAVALDDEADPHQPRLRAAALQRLQPVPQRLQLQLQARRLADVVVQEVGEVQVDLRLAVQQVVGVEADERAHDLLGQDQQRARRGRCAWCGSGSRWRCSSRGSGRAAARAACRRCARSSA